jgi:hypothetical protein
VFTYKARLRSEYSYLNYNNIKIEVNKILSFITVTTGGQTFRTYELKHQDLSGNYQRIETITEKMVLVKVPTQLFLTMMILVETVLHQ